MKLLKYILNFNHRRAKNLKKTGQHLSTLIKCHPVSNRRCMYGNTLRYCVDKPFTQRVNTSPLPTASCTLEQRARIDEFVWLSSRRYVCYVRLLSGPFGSLKLKDKPSSTIFPYHSLRSPSFSPPKS